MAHKIAVLRGDGIGPEVVDQAVLVLEACDVKLEFEDALVGGAAYDETGEPLPDSTLELCRNADAVLLGAVGGPKWDELPKEKRPEIGALLPLRKELNLFANLRPATTFAALASASALKPERGLIDCMIVRELTGGIYFGEPRERRDDGRTAIDTCVYSRDEIERITHVAFELARKRKNRVLSVDKANVLETSRLWRETVGEVKKEYDDVQLDHMLVDNCAMQLVRDPGQFDVILTENMFGDILSDEASMIAGSLGLLPSASLTTPKKGLSFGMYEPVHGSAHDLAGQDRANPLATIMSAAMMLRYSLNESAAAERIENAVKKALNDGLRTEDILETGKQKVSCSEMGEAVRQRVKYA
jgi:3-isopropylmalate dehydrogenase